jgi:cytochrome c biogenesis protein CcdA
MERTNHDQVQPHVKIMTIGQTQPLKAEGHACKASLRGHQQARDHLKRAERDLGETAAFIAASLTTVTAIQAVITVARDKLELSRDILQLAFQGYVAIFLLILLLGTLRVSHAIHRRTLAERDIDQTRKGIFEFCDPNQWNVAEEKE